MADETSCLCDGRDSMNPCAPKSCRRTPCGSCSDGPCRGPLRSVKDVVRAYHKNYREQTKRELRFYAGRTLMEIGLAVAMNEKRHPHQRRIPEAVLLEVCACLIKHQWRCGIFDSFDDLHQKVKDVIGGIHGVGELMIYDTACRIGARIELEPDKVYLHAGTRKGARALGLGWGARFLEREDLPREFQDLKAGEIEDCLCIYEAELKDMPVA